MMSESIGKLTEALAMAQAEFKPAIKDVKNTFFKSNYADLANIVEASRTALTKHGLAVIQLMTHENGLIFLKTILSHKSGEYVSGLYPIKPVKDDPQGLGSAMTYARRYSYAAICGVVTDDDDGEAAHGRGLPKPENSQSIDVYEGTEAQKQILFKILKDMNLFEDKQKCKEIHNLMIGKKLSQAKFTISDYLENK